MKLLQIHSYYEPYLSYFYSRNPALVTSSFNEQIQALIDDGFTGCHIITPYMAEHSIFGQLIVANCPFSQQAWAKENGFTNYSEGNWQSTIVAKQIETIRPDILYISHPIGYDSTFLRQLSWKPKFIFGWRAADIPADMDVSTFDLMLTSCTVCKEALHNHGASVVELHSPGIPDCTWSLVKDTPMDTDVTFVGQWSESHQRRAAYLKEVGKSPLGFRGEFSIAYHLLNPNIAQLPTGVAMYNRGPIFGIDMYRALRRAKIGLNGIIDFAGKEAGNMRMFEVTSVGSLLLTEHDDSVSRYFIPGEEVVTFKDIPDLIDKIYYYLEHEEERRAIAERGRLRCQAEHSLSQKVKRLYGILQTHCPALFGETSFQPLACHKERASTGVTAVDLTRQALLQFNSGREGLEYPPQTQLPEKIAVDDKNTIDTLCSDDVGDITSTKNTLARLEHGLIMRKQSEAEDISQASRADSIHADNNYVPRENLELVRGLYYLQNGNQEAALRAFGQELINYPNNSHATAILTMLQK